MYCAQDACIALDMTEAVSLPSAVYRLLRVVNAVPEMERFVEGVCDSVFRHGVALLPATVQDRKPDAVLQVCVASRDSLVVTLS